MLEFLKFIFPYVKEHRKPFILSTIFIVLGACTQTAMPLYIEVIIDNLNKSMSQQLFIYGFIIFMAIATADYLVSLGT